MKFKNEEEILNQLKEKIKEELVDEKTPFVALDADGTLWPQDVNHILLNYQEEKGLIKWRDFFLKTRGDENRGQRCREAARKQESFSVSDFKNHCREALQKIPVGIFPFQKDLISFLKDQGFKIFIVTASLKYLVEQALEENKISVDCVLGIETKIKQGHFTSDLIFPITYNEGKAEAFLKQSKGKKPLLAGGNTRSDLSLLKLARIPFVVNSATKDNENFSSEQKMKEWLTEVKGFLFEI